MNTDRLFTRAAAEPVRMRQSMYHVLSRTQDDPELQIQTIGLCLYAMCDAARIDIRQLLTTCERIKNDTDGPFVDIYRSVEEYTKNEIVRRI